MITIFWSIFFVQLLSWLRNSNTRCSRYLFGNFTHASTLMESGSVKFLSSLGTFLCGTATYQAKSELVNITQRWLQNPHSINSMECDHAQLIDFRSHLQCEYHDANVLQVLKRLANQSFCTYAHSKLKPCSWFMYPMIFGYHTYNATYLNHFMH